MIWRPFKGCVHDSRSNASKQVASGLSKLNLYGVCPMILVNLGFRFSLTMPPRSIAIATVFARGKDESSLSL